MGIANALPMKREREAPVLLRKCGSMVSIDSGIVEVEVLAARTEGGKEVLAGWCSDIASVLCKLHSGAAGI